MTTAKTTYKICTSPRQAAEGSEIARWRARADGDQGLLDGLIERRNQWRSAIEQAERLLDNLPPTASESRQHELALALARAEAARRQLPRLEHEVERQRAIQAEAREQVDRLWQQYLQLQEQVEREQDGHGSRLSDAQIAQRQQRLAELVGRPDDAV